MAFALSCGACGNQFATTTQVLTELNSLSLNQWSWRSDICCCMWLMWSHRISLKWRMLHHRRKAKVTTPLSWNMVGFGDALIIMQRAKIVSLMACVSEPWRDPITRLKVFDMDVDIGTSAMRTSRPSMWNAERNYRKDLVKHIVYCMYKAHGLYFDQQSVSSTLGCRHSLLFKCFVCLKGGLGTEASCWNMFGAFVHNAAPLTVRLGVLWLISIMRHLVNVASVHTVFCWLRSTTFRVWEATRSIIRFIA